MSKPAGFPELNAWFQTPAGVAVAQQEQDALNEILPTLFGYHLLMVAPPWPHPGLDTSRIGHRVIMYPTRMPQLPEKQLQGVATALPILTDSIDAIVLAHTLEICANPHQVLREVDRCLIPDGHLVLFGFNPWSTWGAWRLAARWRRRAPWNATMIGLPRLKDWLSLLGFETVSVVPLAHRLPVLDSRLPDSGRRWVEKGGFFTSACYALVARKCEIGMTPIRPRWQRHRLLKPRLVEPTTRKAGYG